MEKTSFCFYTGPVTGTANVKMGQANSCIHTHPIFHLMESKQDTCASAVYMSLPITTTFFPYMFF